MKIFKAIGNCSMCNSLNILEIYKSSPVRLLNGGDGTTVCLETSFASQPKCRHCKINLHFFVKSLKKGGKFHSSFNFGDSRKIKNLTPV